MRWLFGALLCCCLQLFSSASDPYCFSEDTDPYNFFSTKTAYEIVREKKLRIGVVPECTPVMIWGLFRHGTRYPHPDELKKLLDLGNLRESILRNNPSDNEMCDEDIALLRGWNLNTNMSQAEMLTPSGVTELQLLAKRLRNNFPDILNAHYTEDRFKIRFTSKERAKQSAEAFTTELFENPIDLPDSFAYDSLLDLSENCSVWKQSTRNEGSERETQKFKNSDLMKSLIWSVSRRLGFRYNLTYEVMRDMYSMCRFDKAWNFKAHSPWCSVFEESHLKVLEFRDDLEYYYRSGYGNPFTTKLGCPLVRDMIESLHSRTLVNNTEDYVGPTAVFNFAHSLTIRAILVRLGMAKDKSPLTADSYSTSDKRQWRTTFLAPFAGNLVAVLYKCADQQYKVMFFLNEHYVEYEGCKVGLCDWSYIYSTFRSEIDPSKCNRDFCNTSGTTAIIPSVFIVLITLFNLLDWFN